MMTTNPTANDILPIGAWRHDAARDEIYAVISGEMPVHLVVYADGEGYNWSADRDCDEWVGGNRVGIGCGHAWTAQRAADDATDAVADWMLKHATPAQMLGYVDIVASASKVPQVELAIVLGVSQSVISDWLAGHCDMSAAVRTHIMRMVGIRRFPDTTPKWALYA